MTRSTSRYPRWAGLIAVLALVLAGCNGSEPPSAAALKAEIERQVPGAELRKDTHISLGRIKLGLAKGLLRVVRFEDDDEIRSIMSNVKKVEVATYEVISMPDIASIETPKGLEKTLEGSGWIAMVRAQEEDSRTWIFLREDEEGSIRNLYIVELDSAELTVVDLTGRLDRVVADLVAEDPSGFIAGLGT